MPSKRLAISRAGTTFPRHFSWPVWFEKATVLSDQVSQPRRCNGNSAAAFPTLPQATQDWIESTVGMSVRVRVHAVVDMLDVEKDDCAAREKETKPRCVH